MKLGVEKANSDLSVSVLNGRKNTSQKKKLPVHIVFFPLYAEEDRFPKTKRYLGE